MLEGYTNWMMLSLFTASHHHHHLNSLPFSNPSTASLVCKVTRSTFQLRRSFNNTTAKQHSFTTQLPTKPPPPPT